MERYAKGLVFIAALPLLCACGGSSAPPTAPVPTPPADVVPPPDPEPPPPKKLVVFNAEPRIVPAGQSTELVWSSPGAASCEAAGAWSGERGPAGRETSPPIVEPTDFVIRCDGAEGTVRVEPEPPLRVVDRFGRTLGADRPLVLVDWEGHMTNVAVEFQLVPAVDLPLPLTVHVRTHDPRLYLDYPHGGDETGHLKTIVIDAERGHRVRLANFPDHDGESETHEISFEYRDADGEPRVIRAPVFEVDQDIGWNLEFPVTVDFSEDTIGFFDDEKKRALVRQAVEDWAYFFADPGLDAVPAQAEVTPLWRSHPDGYVDSYRVKNRDAYRGFLLYAQGFTSGLTRSGGAASTAGGFQAAGGADLPLRRSGSVQIEVNGSYHTAGWFLSDGDDDWRYPWWQVMDLLHVAQHEVGHALIFSPGFPRFEEFKRAGRIDDERVHAYLGEYPRIDSDSHLVGQLDPESLKGAFGNHLNGPMLVRRWIPTKLDLLIAQAIGYTLRPTSAFTPLSIVTEELPDATAGAPYAVEVEPRGGIPFYDWQVSAGSLPPGLELDRFDGIIFGTPDEPGEYTFTVSVTDYPPRRDTATRTYTLTVG